MTGVRCREQSVIEGRYLAASDAVMNGRVL